MRKLNPNSLFIALLALSCTGCASTHAVAVSACPKPPPLSPELKVAPPPPLWASQCLREILSSPKIEDRCLTLLRPYLTPKTTQ